MIVVFGTVCLDRVRRLPHLPAPGGYVEVEDETSALGGEAANTARHLLAWGDAPVLASNPLDDDLRARVGDLDLRELGEPVSEAPMCDVLVTPDGERTMIGRGFSRVDGSLDLARVPLEKGGLFTADSNFPDSALAAARIAKAAGMRAYLMDLVEPDAPQDFWQTSTDWAGAPGDLAANLADVAGRVARTGAFCVLTDGGNGLVAGGPSLPTRAYPAFPPPARVDSTGAGDAFRAGMLHGLARGWSLPACLQFASAAGALAIGHPGASLRISTRGEIARLIADNPQTAVEYA